MICSKLWSTRIGSITRSDACKDATCKSTLKEVNTMNPSTISSKILDTSFAYIIYEKCMVFALIKNNTTWYFQIWLMVHTSQTIFAL